MYSCYYIRLYVLRGEYQKSNQHVIKYSKCKVGNNGIRGLETYIHNILDALDIYEFCSSLKLFCKYNQNLYFSSVALLNIVHMYISSVL